VCKRKEKLTFVTKMLNYPLQLIGNGYIMDNA